MHTAVYTDGSFHSRDLTSGFGVYSPDNIRLCACGPGKDVTNSGLAEYLAIKTALSLILAYHSAHDRVTIYTDYLAAVDGFHKGALTRSNGASDLLDDIAALLIRCQDEEIMISFVKVKGHDGVVGNVIADRLAYLGRVYRLETESTEFQYCVSVLSLHFGASVRGVASETEPNHGLSMLLANIILRPRESVRVSELGQVVTVTESKASRSLHITVIWRAIVRVVNSLLVRYGVSSPLTRRSMTFSCRYMRGILSFIC